MPPRQRTGEPCQRVGGNLMTAIDVSEQVGKDKQSFDVVVFAPRATAPKQFRWNKHVTVGEAADEAAAAFGYAGGTPSLAKGDAVLDRGKQLVAAGVRDGDEL